MTELVRAAQAACLSALKTRRLRLWAAAVGTIVAVLLAQQVAPHGSLLPSCLQGLSPATALAVFLAALVCEYVDSSLGMGYGTMLTPLLLLAGFEPLQVVPCVLLSELVTGTAAGLFHHRDGNVDFLGDRKARSTAAWLSVLSTAGAVAAVAFALKVPKHWLQAIIGIVILSVGVVTLATFRKRLRYRRGHMVALGAVAAFNKGLSGGGYGPLVTAGQVVSGVSPRSAVAITSLAEAFTCAVGLGAYLLLDGRVDWALALPLTLGALLSVPVATLTVRKMHEAAMRSSVGAATCILGLLALAKVFR